jgi:large subunit ribosomal protein L18
METSLPVESGDFDAADLPEHFDTIRETLLEEDIEL